MQRHRGFAQGRLAGGELIPGLWRDADRLPVAQQFFELFCFCAQQLVLAELVALPHLHQVPWREHPEAGRQILDLYDDRLPATADEKASGVYKFFSAAARYGNFFNINYSVSNVVFIFLSTTNFFRSRFIGER